jgi:hypothetical protein
MEKQMEQVFFFNRAFINVIAYMGLSLGLDQEFFNSTLVSALQLSPVLSNMVVGMGIVMWFIKGVWFVYDKFILERAERKKKINE